MPLLVDDDVFCTESPTDGRIFYDFGRYKEVHEMINRAGLIHTLAICAAEIWNHPELIDYIQNRKHEFIFGIHGWNHEKYSTWSKDAIKRSLLRAKEQIRDVFGECSNWYFPTWNKRSPEMYDACHEIGLKLNDNWMNFSEALNGENKEVIRFHSWDENEFNQLKEYVHSKCWFL